MTPATHTLLILLNLICQFQCESLSPDLACPVVSLGWDGVGGGSHLLGGHVSHGDCREGNVMGWL